MLVETGDTAVKEVASISLIILPDGKPGVKINAGPDFVEAGTLEKVSLLCAAIQLCGAAISAIYNDNPGEVEAIADLMASMTIMPTPMVYN